MTPAETIAAAITKLTEQRDAATPGPWLNETGTDYVYTVEDGWTIGSATLTETAELVATLHATIDAQLAVLNAELLWITEGRIEPDVDPRIDNDKVEAFASPAVLILARAIVEAGA